MILNEVAYIESYYLHPIDDIRVMKTKFDRVVVEQGFVGPLLLWKSPGDSRYRIQQEDGRHRQLLDIRLSHLIDGTLVEIN